MKTDIHLADSTLAVNQRQFWLSVCEKTVKTAAQSLLTFMAGGVGLLGISWTDALLTAGLITLGTFALQVSTARVVETGNFWLDTIQRAGKTFLASIAGLWLASSTLLEVDWVQTVSLAGGTALMSLLTSIVSRDIGEVKDSPSIVKEPTTVVINDPRILT